MQEPTPLLSGHMTVLVPDHSSEVTFWLWCSLLKDQRQGEGRPWFFFREDHSSSPRQMSFEQPVLGPSENHRENLGDQVSWSPNCPDLVLQSQKRHLTGLCAAPTSLRAPDHQPTRLILNHRPESSGLQLGKQLAPCEYSRRPHPGWSSWRPTVTPSSKPTPMHVGSTTQPSMPPAPAGAQAQHSSPCYPRKRLPAKLGLGKDFLEIHSICPIIICIGFQGSFCSGTRWKSPFHMSRTT